MPSKGSTFCSGHARLLQRLPLSKWAVFLPPGSQCLTAMNRTEWPHAFADRPSAERRSGGDGGRCGEAVNRRPATGPIHSALSSRAESHPASWTIVMQSTRMHVSSARLVIAAVAFHGLLAAATRHLFRGGAETFGKPRFISLLYTPHLRSHARVHTLLCYRLRLSS